MNEIREIASAATVMRDGRVVETVDVAQAHTRDIVRMMLGHDEQRDELVEVSTAGPVCLSVERLCVPPKLADISFELRRGEVLGFAGLLGAGRTELLQTVAGIRPAASGTIAVDGEAVTQGDYTTMLAHGLALTPENRKDEGIVPLLGVDENTVLTRFDRVSRGGLLSWTVIADAARGIVERMQVKTATLSTPIGTLSGGNQQKVVIGRWVFAGSRILLLDEPTRGVDVESKSQIYAIIRALAREGKSIIFVSSEIEELPKVCDRVLVLRDGRIAETFSAPAIDADTLMAACIAGPGATSTETIAA
jgi:simple sugar transport system ATP-binding protein